MTEKACIIMRINEAANEMVALIPNLGDRRIFARLLNNHIVDSLSNLSSEEKVNRNHLNFHSTEEFIFMETKAYFDPLDADDKVILKELVPLGLEIDRLMDIYHII